MATHDEVAAMRRMIRNGDADDYLMPLAIEVYTRWAAMGLGQSLSTPDSTLDVGKRLCDLVQRGSDGAWFALAKVWAEARRSGIRPMPGALCAGMLVTPLESELPLSHPLPITHRLRRLRGQQDLTGAASKGQRFDSFVARVVWIGNRKVAIEVAPCWMQPHDVAPRLNGIQFSQEYAVVGACAANGFLLEYKSDQVLPLLAFGAANNWAAQYGLPPGMMEAVAKQE